MQPFERLRREHRRILTGLAEVEAAGRGSARRRDFARASDTLRSFATDLEEHMAREEAEVHPLLERLLPEDVGSAAAMRREHETLRGLLALLAHDRGRADEGQASLLGDLALLLRDHIRKEDAVIHPLLERLLGTEARR